jgi:bifunctional UDP-N-acetylglucosamine pyrophosphorylase/glucosamine-1-phosphate N-acetyltransferase
VLGANTIPELVALDATLRARTALRLMLNGVTIFRPETCVIDADVEVGPDTVIEPNVQLLGQDTRIGSDCLIRSGSVIESSNIADKVLVRQYCVVSESTIASGAKSARLHICGPAARSAKRRMLEISSKPRKRGSAKGRRQII